MTNKLLLLALLLATFALGCTQKEDAVKAVEIDRTTSCSLDGMILMDYPGPKAQIQYDKGKPDFFCDTMEMFSAYLQPEQKKRVKAVFTQDMGKTSWEHPKGNWIDAKSAYYVFGSKKFGSMGPTLATFSRREDAQKFVKQYGGKILKFNEVTYNMVALDGGAQHDERM
ncbi:MAG TPA: nitrous oxide reductase accessory protein NosL [Gammaproteobacteria bacterium]|nr:nitrous oxide reductase accessory protein NosL [Gammaproteobacteria bacterium]